MKPVVETHGFRLSNRPSKNYMFHLLYRDIVAHNPARSLEAGAGQLRNFWMYPGAYVGISHNRPAYFRGLTRGLNRPLIRKNGPPEVYLMRLERDFSFLGLFNLCVCTQTIFYVDNPVDVGRRLAERLDKGGALILDDEIERLDQYIAVLAPLFETLDVTFWGFGDADREIPDMPALPNAPAPQRFTDLFEAEMRAPNQREGHAHFYLHARGRLEADVRRSPSPDIISDRGLIIVRDDIPRLKMDD